MKHFSQRTAAITGAASGIGRSLALQLAQAGCHLALADINADALNKTATEARALGINCSTHLVDVSSRSQMEQYAEDAATAHKSVHMIINNAGVTTADYAETQDYDDIEWVMGINFWGVVHGTKSFLPYLKQVDEAHIVNISSLFGLGAVPTQSAYNASKFAVKGYTEALKMELSPTAINVSSVHPGGVQTNIARAARVNETKLEVGKDEFVNRFEQLAAITPERAAQIILKGVQKNKRRIIVGRDAWIVDKVIRLFPAHYEHILRLEKIVNERWLKSTTR